MAVTTPTTVVGQGPATNAAAGAAGGVVSVLLGEFYSTSEGSDLTKRNAGQPFDLIKVRLQTHNSSNAIRVVSDIFRNEGPLAFYKGALLPFLGVGAAVSIQFAVFHSVKHRLEYMKIRSPLPAEQKLSNLDYYLAGGAAGIANSIISGPVEHIRIRLQMQPSGATKIYSGPWDCMSKIARTSGIRGIFKGQNIAVLREFQAYGCYFVTFEACMRMMVDLTGKRREKLSAWSVAPCGALAGVAFWVGSYPLDVIKTKIQNDNFGSNRQYKNAWSAMTQTWKIGKFPAFFRGLGPTLIRTVLSSSGTFVMVENVRKFLA